MRDVYHENRLWAIALLGGCCKVCGTTEDLEFDHIDPELKRKSINKILHHSRFSIVKELKYCQLLCDTHHNEKSARELRK